MNRVIAGAGALGPGWVLGWAGALGWAGPGLGALLGCERAGLGLSGESRRPAWRVPGGGEANWLVGGLAYRPPVGGVVAGVVGGVLVGGVLVGGVLAAAWATYSVIAWPLATTVCGFGLMLSTVLGVALLVW
jgi:hypothetical protein